MSSIDRCILTYSCTTSFPQYSTCIQSMPLLRLDRPVSTILPTAIHTDPIYRVSPNKRNARFSSSLYSASQKKRKPINQVNFSENCNDLSEKVYIVTKFSSSSFFWHQKKDVLVMHGRAWTISNGDVKIDLRRIALTGVCHVSEQRHVLKRHSFAFLL